MIVEVPATISASASSVTVPVKAAEPQVLLIVPPLLVKELEQRHGDKFRLIISTTTDTGYQRAVERYAPQHEVVRYPLAWR